MIPSSTKRENLASNLLAQTLRLTDEDMAQIAALERNGREVDPAGLRAEVGLTAPPATHIDSLRPEAAAPTGHQHHDPGPTFSNRCDSAR